MDGYVGEIRMFAGPRVPEGWLWCNGAEYPNGRYPQLFLVIGTQYGGGGEAFRVPDLRGRSPIGTSSETTPSGLESIALGQTVGSTTIAVRDVYSDPGQMTLQGLDDAVDPSDALANYQPSLVVHFIICCNGQVAY